MDAFVKDSPEIKDRVLIANQLAFAFLSHMPIVPGHTLICPTRIVASCEWLTSEEWGAILALKQQISRALVKAFDATGFNFAWNLGSEAGQTVPHFHLHVVPRKTGDSGILQYEPRVFLYRPGTRAISPSEELQNTADLIKLHL